jgi:5-methylcytosine-specific restriction enzyme B
MFKPTMKILYGPPGTGKTWLAAREAVAAVNPKAHKRWLNGEISDSQVLDLHRRYVLKGRIKWVTFHPSYSYEDFVEGFRPVLSSAESIATGTSEAKSEATGQSIAFAVRSGPFRQICEFAAGHPIAFGPPLGSRIDAIGGSKTYEVIGSNDQGWLLRVRPNRSDQVGETQEKFVPRSIIQKASELSLEPKIFSIPGSGNVLPTDYGMPGSVRVKGSDLRRAVAEQLGISSSDLANSAHFGAVATYIRDSQARPPKPVRACLVIDEINRADLSRVFGELITLLEPDKRIGAPEERRVHLPYSGEERFGVPSTLSIIGTLNTADRSITTMDFAMRRRFTFVEIGPDSRLCPADYGGSNVAAALDGINRRVAILRGRDYQLGHSSFMESFLEDVRLRMNFDDTSIGKLRALAYVMRTRVTPLLLEYFHEDWRKIEVALGVRGKVFGTATKSMFSTHAVEAKDAEQFDEVFDTTRLALGHPAEWWNPERDEFDATAFAQAIAVMS